MAKDEGCEMRKMAGLQVYINDDDDNCHFDIQPWPCFVTKLDVDCQIVDVCD